jgi:hypothetical protein
MAIFERSSLSCKQWAKGISGDEAKESHWRAIFDEHSEFFRSSARDTDHYTLIWRRAMPRRYYRRESRMLSQPEFAALTAEEKKSVTRPPVPEPQLKTLVEMAITLHARQQEQGRDWRWWVPSMMGFVGSIVGAAIGVWFGTRTK